MIVVTVGTNEARFDRLLAWLEPPPGEPVLVQHGPSPVRVPGAEHVDFLPFEDLVARLRGARAVVTHAGVGSIMVALSNGLRPVVVPRLARLCEAVDDHQVPLARRLHEAGLVTLVEHRAALAAALADEAAPAAPAPERATRLAIDLRASIARLAG